MFDLNSLWFVLIAVLWIGFYFLEGFDLGVGMLLPFLGRKDEERRAIINAIGPHWDGNEVWLLTAGGATFAAFPHWYATMFSGFYLALFLMLFGLIIRGVIGLEGQHGVVERDRRRPAALSASRGVRLLRVSAQDPEHGVVHVFCKRRVNCLLVGEKQFAVLEIIHRRQLFRANVDALQLIHEILAIV